jgi:hypothetical protein
VAPGARSGHLPLKVAARVVLDPVAEQVEDVHVGLVAAVATVPVDVTVEAK